ncbi:MAG: MMPL family transporter [Tissierellia bacterium]|nr:MMPL family transporter [Tissierellia bacterium]
MLSRLSVKKPYTVVVAVILVLILGSISFINLQTDLLPSIELPYLVIMTTYPGASPEEVEMVVTRPIEQVVATASNIKNINSISSENTSIVILEFNNDVNMDSSIIEINGSLDLIKSAWNDSVGTPMIIRLNPDMLPIGIFSVDMEDMDVVEISDFVDSRIIPELESIEGVASVSGVGLIEENVEVFINPDKIDDLNRRILDKVDSKLAEAEAELKKAKNEIEDGKERLNTEERTQRERLEEGEKALNLAKDQIAQGEAGINAGILELNKNIGEVQDLLNELNEKEEELKASENLLLEQGDQLSQEDRIKLLAIQESLKQLSQSKIEAEMGLKTLQAKLEELELQKASLEEKKLELSLQEKQIVEGKSILEAEMNKARAQLVEGEKVLNEKLDEFEEAREEAFKKASLEGVITSKMISGMLAAQNFSMPAGYVSEEGIDYLVKVGDKIKDIDEIKNLLLFDTGEEGIGKIYLKDVADIDYKDNSEEVYAKINGNNGVILTFQKQSNYSTTEVSKNIEKKMEELRVKYEGLNFTTLMDQGIYIGIVIDSVLDNLVYGGILAILILIVFLRDIKPTFVIALSIPISLIFAIAMMYFTGVTLNLISLAGLALGVGMLVDNSIVVIENIYRLRNEGMSPIKAAIEGAKEVGGAIMASTLTTVCVFLPIVFTKGISRQLFVDMGLTIAYSLLASLIVALSLVPSMASTILKNTKEKEDRLFDKFLGFYEKILRWSLSHRAIVIVGVTLLLGLSGYLAVSMGTAFIPEMETPQMSLTLEMPKESSFKDTVEMSDLVIDRIIDIEDVETIGAFHGQGMVSFGQQGNSTGNTMSMYIILNENKKMTNLEIEKEILERTKDLDCKISVNTSNMDMSALGGSGIEVLVKGRDLDGLRDVGYEIGAILESVEGTKDIRVGEGDSLEEIRITVDKEKAMEKGLTVAQVFSEVNSLLAKSKSATTLTVSNKDYPVIVVDGESKNLTTEDIKDLSIKVNRDGEESEVKIGDIAKVTEEVGPTSIRRKDQERYISVRASIDKDYNIGLVSRDFEDKLEEYKLLAGYSIELAGENEIIKESMRDLIYMILLAIAFIYLIMVAQFQSLLSPFIVMFTIPLAFTGGLLALVITGHEISLIAMLGFLVLSGVVVNNGIVFVDYTNQLRERDIETREALVLAGKTRMRPILMTAITTILGLSTLSLGVGVGAEMVQPLAITAIGGLTYATILTLVVVPVMYSLFHKKKIRNFSLEGDE